MGVVILRQVVGLRGAVRRRLAGFRRGAVHGLVEIAQHLVSVGQAEDLAGELLDALIVGPGVAGHAHVHGASAVAGKQAGGQKFQSNPGAFDDAGQCRAGALAPAAQRGGEGGRS